MSFQTEDRRLKTEGTTEKAAADDAVSAVPSAFSLQPSASPSQPSAEHLAEHLDEVMTPSSVIVCVGNELCGDDGAGVEVAKRLKGGIPWPVFDTQTVPESFLMKIVELRPDSVVLVDALAFGAEPGAVELVQATDVRGQGPSTHGPAPLAFLELLQMMHACRVAVLGVQPGQDDFGTGLSEPVKATVEKIVEAFRLLGGKMAPP